MEPKIQGKEEQKGWPRSWLGAYKCIHLKEKRRGF